MADETVVAPVATEAKPAESAATPSSVPAVTDVAKAGTEGATTEGKTDPAKAQTDAVEYTFTAPEGVTLDEKLVAEFTPLAKEMGLKPDQAQKLVDLYAKAQQDGAKAYEAQVVAMEAGWREEIKTDAVYGGPKFEQTVAVSRKAVERFETEVPGLKAFFEQTGTGSHPVMVKLFAALGSKISEDRPPAAATITHADIPLSEKMYPNSK